MLKPHGSDTLNPLYVADDAKRAALVEEAAGLKSGDRLVALDGILVGSAVRLTNLVSAWPAGARVALRLVREGRGRIVVTTLGARPEGVR